MEVFALFTDGTSEKIEMDLLPKKQEEKGLVIKTTIHATELKHSAINSIENTWIALERHGENIPSDLVLCVYGFSKEVTGSSADLAFAVTLLALLLNEGVIQIGTSAPSKIAATGVIDERLQIRAIRGIKEKVIAAVECGAKWVLIPTENLIELEEHKKNDAAFLKLTQNIQIQPVQSLKEVFRLFGIMAMNDRKNDHIKKTIAIRRNVMTMVIFAVGFFVIASSLVYMIFLRSIEQDHIMAIQVEPTTSMDKEVPMSLGDQSKEITPAPIIGTPTLKSEPSNINTRDVISPIFTTPITTPPYGKDPMQKRVPNTVTNALGNVENGGFLAVNGENLLYSAEGLFRMDFEGTNKSKILEDSVSSLQVLGEYVFFINQKNDCIYKMDNQGGTPRKLNNDAVFKMMVRDNFIYYISKNDYKPYKMSTDGMDKTLLCQSLTSIKRSVDTYFSCNSLWITENHLYFSVHFKEDPLSDGIYRIDSNLEEQVMLFNGSYRSIEIDEGVMYFIDEVEGCLYQGTLDGKEQKKIIPNRINAYLVNGGWVYYGDQNGIFKVHSNGKGVFQLSQDETNAINLIGDDLFYYNLSDGNRLFRMKIDGVNQKNGFAVD
jgi:hypothetical protein